MRSFLFVFCLYLLGCHAPEPRHTEPASVGKPDSSQSTPNPLPPPQSPVTAVSIEDLTHFVWSPRHPDTTGWLLQMRFEDEYALYFFHGQCHYYFFTYTTYANSPGSIVMLWSYKTDCLLDMSFLKQTYGLRTYPKHGDAFASYKLINDSTLSVEYRFPDWVRRVNAEAGDSLFPQRLYRQKPEDL